VLVANRGEIAVRVIRACRELGIATAAVYSEADAGALHARLADEAHPCGPAPARQSYLDAERLVGIARRCGADAVHPGYGFLAENGDFAERCAKQGLRFIGPSAAVIRLMGDKVASRRVAARAGVPPVPGTEGTLSDDEVLGAAARLGYPVVLKASGGGGGRGMRVVGDPTALAKALPRARSEAASAFASDAVYLEKLVERPRHVEVQVLADRHGATLQLFERDCSIQRRHQKVVEEAPAPRLDPGLRGALGAAALAVTRAVDYEGAGTVEFLLDARGAFYFLEMNTRIQVEHAVTEAITGVDLVKAQIRAAAGEPLGLAQGELAMRGHAIEARVYAEDPARRFLPSPGVVGRLRLPGGPGIRVDTGLEQGDEVTVHYDPMIAKLVAWGADRAEAIDRLRRALDEFELEGIRTTLPFHRRVVRHPAFRDGAYDTGFIAEHLGGGAG
jgi:acetyl-CoA carboxylase biotin carboxylase subunit